MGLRERHKTQRREQILAAAQQLLRGTGGTNFSMRQLAGAADVSLATPYNLFGSKSAVLYALYAVAWEQLGSRGARAAGGDAREDVLTLAGIAAAEFSVDAAYFRPLIRFLLGVRDAEARSRVMLSALDRWTQNIVAAQRIGLIRPTANIALLARQLLISFNGAVELWLHEELDGDGFVAQSLYGSAIVVMAHAPDAARPDLEAHMLSLERRLAPELAFAAPEPKRLSANRTAT